MIYIKDNFLPKNIMNLYDKDKSSFQKVDTPGKSFWVKETSEVFVDFISYKIAEIEKTSIENILCFFRQAKENQDNDWRIHNDSIIEGQKPDRALVLYLTEDTQKGLNGTAFWSHIDYGDVYNGEGADEFNKILSEDSNDKSKWKLKSVIGHKKNRLISYPCNYFHSKYPNEFKEKREVLVMFYKIKNNAKQ
mgnify:FL=1